MNICWMFPCQCKTLTIQRWLTGTGGITISHNIKSTNFSKFMESYPAGQDLRPGLSGWESRTEHCRPLHGPALALPVQAFWSQDDGTGCFKLFGLLPWWGRSFQQCLNWWYITSWISLCSPAKSVLSPKSGTRCWEINSLIKTTMSRFF